MDKLRTEHLYKKYGKRTVVNDVSIYLEQGEIVGLLGPNGAGKTTTFYMTTGLVTANNGKIFLNDLDITSMPMYQRAKLGIGYLPQEASVFRKMSVEDNILSVLEMTNFTKEYQQEKLEQLKAQFNGRKLNIIVIEDKVAVLAPLSAKALSDYTRMVIDPKAGPEQATRLLLDQLWLGGVEEIRNDEDYFMSAMVEMQNLIELKKSTSGKW